MKCAHCNRPIEEGREVILGDKPYCSLHHYLQHIRQEEQKTRRKTVNVFTTLDKLHADLTGYSGNRDELV